MRRKAFLDRSLILRDVTCLPPLRLLAFLDWLELAWAEVAASQKPTADLYTSDRFFQQVCDRALALHDIEPDWCDPELVDRLLFNPGLLVELNRNLKTAERSSGRRVTLERYVAGLIASLIETEGGVRGAIAAVGSVPADLLDVILQARIDQIKPDSEDSTGWQEFEEELAETDVLEMGDIDAMAAAFGFK